MTLEQQIVTVAESLADKCHNPVRRNTNLWKELRRHYIAGIEAWIQYKLFQEQEQSGQNSLPSPSQEPFNQNTMTPELTPQEIEQIPDWIIKYDEARYQSSAGKAVRFLLSAITSERLKHKAEIQAYREFLEYIIEVRKDKSVSKEMLAVFAGNVIVKYQNHQLVAKQEP